MGAWKETYKIKQSQDHDFLFLIIKNSSPQTRQGNQG